MPPPLPYHFPMHGLLFNKLIYWEYNIYVCFGSLFLQFALFLLLLLFLFFLKKKKKKKKKRYKQN